MKKQQQLSGEFKNGLMDTSHICSSASLRLNREETLSASGVPLPDNSLEENLHSGKSGLDLRVPVVNLHNTTFGRKCHGSAIPPCQKKGLHEHPIHPLPNFSFKENENGVFSERGNKCKYCNVKFYAQGDFCSEPCEHDWFEARLKKRVSAYKGHWTCVLETDFRGIFCKQAEKHKIRIPTSQLASEITQAFIKVINVATTEELKEMNYNLDEYQLCKKHERW